MGFDEEKAVNEAFYAGRNTFQKPLTFDFVAASGGDVCYGYFTVRASGEGPTVVNVPLFASAATAFLAAGKSCLFDQSDDAACDNQRAFTYERYLAVGDGDIASVAADVWKTRGTPTGVVEGVVQMSSGDPGANAHVFLFRDPDANRMWDSVDEVAEANYRAENDVGLLDVVDADVGLDFVEDGDFTSTTIPRGHLPRRRPQRRRDVDSEAGADHRRRREDRERPPGAPRGRHGGFRRSSRNSEAVPSSSWARASVATSSPARCRPCTVTSVRPSLTWIVKRDLR